MNPPAIRVDVESGQTYDDPSDELVSRLLKEFEGREHEFFIMERVADPDGQTYLQAAHCEEPPWDYVVEYRDGGPDRHFQAFTSDLEFLHAVVKMWITDEPGWRSAIAWTPVDFDN